MRENLKKVGAADDLSVERRVPNPSAENGRTSDGVAESWNQNRHLNRAFSLN